MPLHFMVTVHDKTNYLLPVPPKSVTKLWYVPLYFFVDSSDDSSYTVPKKLLFPTRAWS